MSLTARSALWPVVTGLILCLLSGFCRADWRTDAKAGWERYREVRKRLQGMAEYSSGSTGEEMAPVTQMHFKQNENCWQLIIDRTSLGHTRDQVISANSRYTFFATRNLQTDPWKIATGRLAGQDKAIAESYAPQLERLTSMQFGCQTIMIWDLVDRPSFRELKSGPITLRGRELFELQFESPHAMRDELPFSPIQRGRIVMDPANLWCLVEASFNCTYDNDSSKVLANFEYNSQDGVPLVTHAEFVVQASNGTKYISLSKPNFYLAEDLPDEEEFLLPAFGIEEPIDLQPPPLVKNWDWIWAVGLAVIAVAVGAFALIQKRRAEEA